jgi:hypothetical protein
VKPCFTQCCARVIPVTTLRVEWIDAKTITEHNLYASVQAGGRMLQAGAWGMHALDHNLH